MRGRLTVDLTYALDRALGDGRGLSRAAFEEAVAGLPDLATWMADEPQRRALLELPLDRAPADAVQAWAEAAPAARDVVVVGIGGSALAARVFDGVAPPEGDRPRLHVIDTVDPAVVGRLRGGLDPGATLLLGISKSGSTLETMSVFPTLVRWLHAALGDDARARIAVVCGPDPSPLRERARAAGYARFDVPPPVGGRYSALTPVGLLPAACVGVDPRALLAGAEEARARCIAPRPADNPALALAAVHAAAEAAGRCVAVLWPYGARLEPLGPWWAQLVGESLGKPAAGGPAGVTALAARGPADQHSLLQLLVDGPDDKLTVFVDAPAVPAESGEADLGAVLAAEREATEYALAASGRPSIRIRLPAADARAAGAFLLTYQVAVVYWARLLGVDPFGQPGVALGKRAAQAALTGEPADVAARLEAHRARGRTQSS